MQPCLYINRRGGGIKVNELLNTFKVKSKFDTMAKSTNKSKSKKKKIHDRSDEKEMHKITQTFDHQHSNEVKIQGEDERFNAHGQHSLTERLIEPPSINDLKVDNSKPE